MSFLRVKIVTPERLVAEIEAVAVTLPIIDGDITMLPHHEPYIGALGTGEIVVHQNTGLTENLAISGGFVEFDTNTLSILVDTAERAEEIDIERADAARKRAEEMKHERVSMDEEEYARVAAALEKEMTRLKVARKHRSRMPISIIGSE